MAPQPPWVRKDDRNLESGDNREHLINTDSLPGKVTADIEVLHKTFIILLCCISRTLSVTKDVRKFDQI